MVMYVKSTVKIRINYKSLRKQHVVVETERRYHRKQTTYRRTSRTFEKFDAMDAIDAVVFKKIRYTVIKTSMTVLPTCFLEKMLSVCSMVRRFDFLVSFCPVLSFLYAAMVGVAFRCVLISS